MARTTRMTTAQAIVKFLDNQYVSMDGRETKFVEGFFTPNILYVLPFDFFQYFSPLYRQLLLPLMTPIHFAIWLSAFWFHDTL